MGQIGAGNSGSSYPGALDTLLYGDGAGHSNYLNGMNEIVDSQTRMDAEALNDVIDAVLAIQTELGTNPSGGFATVAARFGSLGSGGFPGDPGSSTDNAIVRWDGTDGSVLQNSGVVINDAKDTSGINDLTMTGNITATGALINTINGSILGAMEGSNRDIQSTVYGGTGSTIINEYSGRRARGTQAAPIAVGAGDVFVRFSGKGHDGALFTASPTTWMDMLATETWNDVFRGSAITLNTTITGTLTQAEVIRFVDTNVLIGTITYGTNLTKGLVIGSGTAPSTSPTDAIQLWSEDQGAIAGDAALTLRTEIGRIYSFGNNLGIGTTTPASPIHIVREGVHTSITVDSYYTNSGASNILFRKAYGTLAAPTRPGVGAAMGNISGLAWSRDAANTIDQFTVLSRLTQNVDSVDAQGRMGGRQALWLSPGISAALVEMFRWDQGGNYLIGTTTRDASLTKGLVMGLGTAPVTSPVDVIQLWAADRAATAGKGSLHLRTEDGTSHVFGDRVGLNTLIPVSTLEVNGLITTVDLTVTGTATLPSLTISAINATTITASGLISGGSLTITGATNVADLTASGAINAASVTATGILSGASLSVTDPATTRTNLGLGTTNAVQFVRIGIGVAPSATVPLMFASSLGQKILLYGESIAAKYGINVASAEMQIHSATTGRVSIGGMSTVDGTTYTPHFIVSSTTGGNVGIGQTTWGTSAAKVLGISSGTAPTTSPADAIQMWSADTGGVALKAGLHLRTEDGTSHVFGDMVGIGTLTPTVALDVIGALKVSDVTTTITNLGLGTASAVQFARIGIGIAPSATYPLMFPAAVGQKILLYGEGLTVRNGFAIGSGVLQIFSNGRIDFGFMTAADGVTFNQNVSISTTGNLGIGTSSFGTSATKTLGLFNGVAPTTSPVDTVQLWSADTGAVAGKAGLHIRTEDGTSHVFGDMVGLNTLIPAATVHVVSTMAGANFIADRYTDDAFGPRFDIRKARGTVAVPAKVLLNDVLSYWLSMGYARNAANTADAWIQAAYINASVDNIDVEGRIGGRIGFFTNAGVSANPVLRMTLKADGTLNMVSGNLITLNESGTNKYGLYFGGGNSLRIFASDSASTTSVSIGAMSTIDGTTYTQVMRIMAQAKSVIIGTGTAIGTSGQGVLAFNNGVAPTTNIANMVQLWSADIGGVGDASLHIRSETGMLYGFAGAGLAIGTGSFIPIGNVHIGGGLSGMLMIDRNDTSITFPQIQMRKSRGTYSAPLVTIEGDRSAAFYGLSYVRNAADTADAYLAHSLMMYRVSNFDAQGRAGGDISWWTSSGVSAGVTEKMYLNSLGQLGIGVVYNTPLPAGTLLTVANGNVTTGGLVLTSQRIGGGILLGHILNGIDFWSNDSNLTQPGLLAAYIRAKATESHSTTGLGTELEFAVTKNATIVPAVVMRLNHLSNVILFGGVAGTTLEKGLVMGAGIAPTASSADNVQMWVMDREATAGTASLHILGEAVGASHVFGDRVGLGLLEPIGAFHTLGGTNYFERADATTAGVFMLTRKSRGTHDAPSKVLDGDILTYWASQAWARNAADTADAWMYLTRIDTIVNSVDAVGHAGGAMIFYTAAPVTTTLTERMRITEDGFVGIGMAAPISRLHIVNNDVLSSGVVLASQRVPIVLDNILNGLDFHSNDTNLSPSVLTAYIRTIADETHTATTLGTRMAFATTAIGAVAPTLRMTLKSDGVLSFHTWVGQKINLYETATSKYGLGIGSSQIQLYSPDTGSARVEIGGMDAADGVTFIPVFRVIPISKNIILGTATAVGASGSFVFGINSGVAPTAGVADMVQLWSSDVDATAGTASLHIMAENGVVARIGSWITARLRTVSPTTASLTVPLALVRDESLSVIVALNTTEKSQINLPAASLGTTYTFIVQATPGLRIRAFTGDIIRIVGVGSSASAGFAESTVLYSTLTITAATTSAWIATAVTGTWTVG